MNLPKGWSRRYHLRELLAKARKIAACQHEHESSGWCIECGARKIEVGSVGWIVPTLVHDLNWRSEQMPAARRKKETA
jgi:hypothetical protein